MSVISDYLQIIKIVAGLHINRQVNDSAPQGASVTQSQKSAKTVSRLVPVMDSIKERRLALAHQMF